MMQVSLGWGWKAPGFTRSLCLCAVLLAAGSALAGCASGPSEQLKRAQAHEPSATEASLIKGQQLYEQKCGTCHMLAEPTKYNAEEWRTWVKNMAPLAKISGEEEQAVLHYLLSASAE